MSLFGDQPLSAGPDGTRIAADRPASLQTYEYDTVEANVETLNSKAKDGWRVIAVVPRIDFQGRGRGYATAYLERPVT